MSGKYSLFRWHVSRNLYENHMETFEKRKTSSQWDGLGLRAQSQRRGELVCQWCGENRAVVLLSRGTHTCMCALMHASASGSSCTWSPLQEGAHLNFTEEVEQSNRTFPKAINKGTTEDACEFWVWFQNIGKNDPSKIEEAILVRINHARNWQPFWKLQQLICSRNGKKTKRLEGYCAVEVNWICTC